MKSIRTAISKMDAQIENLRNKRENIRYSGRDKDWQQRELDESVSQTKAKIKDLQHEALSGWLHEYAEAKKTDKKDNYAERTFYQQKFSNMLQQVSPEKVPELFKKVASDPETAPYKSDFCDLADLKVDSENRQAFETAKQEKMTEAEKEQAKKINQVANMKNHLSMINNMANDLLVDEVAKGKSPSMSLAETFDEAVKNSEKVGRKSVNELAVDPEYKKQVEDAMSESRNAG